MSIRWYWILLIAVVFGVSAVVVRPAVFPERLPVVGILHPDPTNLATAEGLIEALADAGWRDGETVRIVHDGPTGGGSGLPRMLRMLVDEQPDVIVAASTPAALTALGQTRALGIPLVFAAVSDPVAAGLLTRLDTPEPLVTGIRLSHSDGERLRWMTRLAPNVRRVLVPYNPDDPTAVETIVDVTEAGAGLSLSLDVVPVPTDAAVTALLQTMPDVDAVFLPRDRLVESYVKAFSDLAIERGVPLSAPSWTELDAGAFYSFGFLHSEVGRQAAGLVIQVLEGGRPSDLAVQVAENYLGLNLETGRAIDLAVPEDLRAQARWILDRP